MSCRSEAVTPRGGRACRFEETACGTERFLGRGLRMVAVVDAGKVKTA
jgi:hypothetical protein